MAVPSVAARPDPGPATPPVSTTPAGPLVLVGNPNVGKSVLFRQLTNRYVTVSNFPGTTVEIARARACFGVAPREVIDAPGLNDLAPRADEGVVTRRLLEEHPDGTIVQVADARNLRRALLLTLQLASLRRPMVLVLNMLDELAARGGRIDREALSKALGVPVVGTVATTGEGVPALVDALDAARPARAELGDTARASDRYARNRELLERANRLLVGTYTIAPPARPTLGVRLGFWAMHPVRGLAVLAAALVTVFWVVGLLAAGSMVDVLEVGVFERHVNPAAIHAADAVFRFPHTHRALPSTLEIAVPVTPVHGVTIRRDERPVTSPTYDVPAARPSGTQRVARVAHDALVGEFGLITMGLSYALAIVLPIVAAFFLVFSVLEDSGYFPRMAIMVHRVFKVIGLNGKAVLPMILGLGCDTMATMTTRILGSRRDRVVTTMLLALAVPCSAQLGVLLALMGRLTPAAAAAWVAVVLGIVVLVGWLTARVMGGEPGEFILEIPPMRRPVWGNVVTKTVSRVWWYLKEVVPIFLVGTALLFVLDGVHVLGLIARAGAPVVTGWLGLPAETANAFLVGFLRRDFGAVYLLDAATGSAPILSAHQVLVAMVTITLFMPCIANFLMIVREHGAKVGWSIAAFIFPFAVLVGGVVHRVGLWLGI